jgi:hypothetical protein
MIKQSVCLILPVLIFLMLPSNDRAETSPIRTPDALRRDRFLEVGDAHGPQQRLTQRRDGKLLG